MEGRKGTTKATILKAREKNPKTMCVLGDVWLKN